MESSQIVVYAIVEEYRSVRDKEGIWYKVSDAVDMTSLSRGCIYNAIIENDQIMSLEKVVRKLRKIFMK